MAGARGGTNSDGNSDDWLNARGVRERIQELQERNAERSEITRQEALRWLADSIRTPIGSVGKDSALVQAYEEDSAGDVKVRLADKISGMQQLSKMTGWNEPERVEVSADTLSHYIIELRKEPIFGGGRAIDTRRCRRWLSIRCAGYSLKALLPPVQRLYQRNRHQRRNLRQLSVYAFDA